MKAKNIFLWILLLGRIVCVWGNKKFWDPEMAATTWCCESEDVSIPGMSKVPLKKNKPLNGLGVWGCLFGLQVANCSFLRELKDKGKRCEPSMTPL